jgi:hypothetical protein
MCLIKLKPAGEFEYFEASCVRFAKAINSRPIGGFLTGIGTTSMFGEYFG